MPVFCRKLSICRKLIADSNHFLARFIGFIGHLKYQQVKKDCMSNNLSNITLMNQVITDSTY